VKKVIMTGASGFIGRHCIKALKARNYEIIATYFNCESVQEIDSSIRWHRINLFDRMSLNNLIAKVRPTHLLHLAWDTTTGSYLTSQENLNWLGMSLSLFKKFVSVGGKRMVGVGSCAEYEACDGLCREYMTPANPTTPYGQCKDKLRKSIDRLIKAEGVSFAWTRLFQVYGPYENPERFIPYLISSFLSGDKARCTEGNQVRDFLYVEDVADALVHILDTSIEGPINVASGVRTHLRDIAETIQKKMNKRDLVQLGAVPVPPYNPTRAVADISRLRDEAGWAHKVDIDSGLDNTIQWWEQHLAVNQ
jgi:nucleoside-diphosphate-sugar epimerase